MKLVFGLGNPEKKFDNTPHNVGFCALDKLSEKLGAKFSKKKLLGLVAETDINGETVLLVKPQTYMNLSGECVFKFVKKFKVPLTNILVMLDDIDLPLGDFRFREKGSGGTHNGLKNIVAMLKTEEFARIRIGVGKPPEHMDLADFVLSKLNKEQLDKIEVGIEDATEKALEFLQN